ncbi:grb10 interacting GYF, putative [Babesia caballi]|uniref:Grb10 interacting GYF, putative n=1 Tax=Babesia caballi TaxID=5871 RepID=A0AAV4LUV9_BABCB|nr:grb10 interacting GYF, putative [Babesia caballi]
MFHPRPFGGAANMLAKSTKGEPEGRGDGLPVAGMEVGTPVPDTPSHERAATQQHRVFAEDGEHGVFKGMETRRMQEDPQSFADSKILNEQKLFAEQESLLGSRLLADPKHFGDAKQFTDHKPLANLKTLADSRLLQGNHGDAFVVPRLEPQEPLTKLEIPESAVQEAATQGIYDRLYLVHLMINFERVRVEKGISVCDIDPPKFKFVESQPPMRHNAVPRELGGATREAVAGLYAHAAQSKFDQGDASRKSMDIAGAQRRGYFDQRSPKGKDAFRMGREGFDPDEYTAKSALQDADSQRSKGPLRWKSYEETVLSQGVKCVYEKFKSTDAVSMDADRPAHLNIGKHLNRDGQPFSPLGKTAALHSESDVALHNILKASMHNDRVDMRSAYHQFGAGRAHHADKLISLVAERPPPGRSSGDVHFAKTGIPKEGSIISESTKQQMLQYTAFMEANAKGSWKKGAQVPVWKKGAASGAKPPQGKPSGVKGENRNLSFLERLLDKSFDAAEPTVDAEILEAASQFKKTMQLGLEQAQLQANMQQSAKSSKRMTPQMTAKSQPQPPVKSPMPTAPQPQAKLPVQVQSQTPAKAPSQLASPAALPSKSPMPLQSKSPMPLQSKSPMSLEAKSPMPLQCHSPLELHSQPQSPLPTQLSLQSPTLSSPQLQSQPQPQWQSLATLNLQWQYKDFHGLVHGPFSSKQMYTWYINNFFNPNLQMRYNQKMPWSTFKELYPAGTSAFVDDPVGVNRDAPAKTPLQQASEPAPPVASNRSPVKDEPMVLDEVEPGGDSPPAASQRWNKPDELKVDSLLDIMEKQKRQSVPKAPTKEASPRPAAKPLAGWKVSNGAASSAGAAPVATDDFPTLALVAEKSAKPRKKAGAGSSQQQHQHSTMSLKAFMKHHAQTPENTKVQPRESFASKLMGDNK